MLTQSQIARRVADVTASMRSLAVLSAVVALSLFSIAVI